MWVTDDAMMNQVFDREGREDSLAVRGVWGIYRGVKS